MVEQQPLEQQPEVQTAETSESVTNSSSTTTTPKAKGPKLNERGVPVQNWDPDGVDPNKRKHVGDDPKGEHNAKLLEKK